MNLTEALWYLGRGTGLVALVMFTVTMVLGITTRSGRAGLGLNRFGLADLHKTASLAGTGLIAVHVGTLLFDPYAQLRLVDLAVPFLATYRPLWLGLGTLAVDVLLVLVATSLLRHRVGPRVFRAVHWTAYAMWPLALVHALGTGTDAGTGRGEQPAGVGGGGEAGGDRHRVTAFRAGSVRGMRRLPRSANEAEVRQPTAAATARTQVAATALAVAPRSSSPPAGSRSREPSRRRLR